MIAREFSDWLVKSRPGQSIEYHLTSSGLGLRGRNDAMLLAWKAMEGGDLMLFQKRLGEGKFSYIAVKRAKRVPVIWRGCYDPNRSKYAALIAA